MPELETISNVSTRMFDDHFASASPRVAVTALIDEELHEFKEECFDRKRSAGGGVRCDGSCARSGKKAQAF